MNIIPDKEMAKPYNIKPYPKLVEQPKNISTNTYQEGYKEGFKDGFASADLSIPGMVLCGIGILALIISCVMVMRHSSRVVAILCKRFQLEIPKKTTQKLTALFLPLFFCSALAACAQKNGDMPPSPLPETAITVQSDGVLINKNGSETIDYEQTETSQSIVVEKPTDKGGEPLKNEPAELKNLLEEKNENKKQETAVSQMRPSAIREAAQLATFQKAMAWRYGQLASQTEEYANILDTAFNFSPLLLTQGQALIMPPMLAKSGASMRIEDGDTATSAKATYELLEPARYIASTPTWREFLMVDNFPQAEEPNPALLPKTSEERKIWRDAVREAWREGIEQADQLYADNVARMGREYRGIMLYHLLTAQHLLSKVNTASADLGRHATGNKLNIGQQVYRITKPSSFILNPGKTQASKKAKRNRK